MLAVLRPVQACWVLAGSAVLAFLVQIVLGIIAGQIDPQWSLDEIDKGSVAAMTLFFCMPAMVTAVLLLIGGTPVAGGVTRGGDAPHPA